MSLINKMLQDLDARGNARSADIPLEVKPVPQPAARPPLRRIAAITAALLAVALGAAAWALLPIKGKTFDPRPPLASTQATPAPMPAPAPVDAAPVTVAEVAPAPVPAAAAPDVPAEPTPAAESAAAQEAAPARARPSAAPSVARMPAEAPRTPRETPAPPGAVPAASTTSTTSTTTWAVASARARAEQERLARRWAAEERRIATLPPGERAAATRRLRAEQDSAARKARTEAAWIAAFKRKEIAAGTFAGAVEGDEARPAAGQAAGRSETALQRADNGYRRALASLQEGRVTDAIAGLQAALRINPRHEAARQTLVGLLIENKRIDEATGELQQALTLDPRQPALAMLLARLQIERGGSGIEVLLRTLPYAAGDADYHGFLAAALQRQGRHREAAEQYQAALRGMPGKAVWWMGLGISLQAEKRNAEALDAFRRAQGSSTLSQELQGFVERKIAQLAH